MAGALTLREQAVERTAYERGAKAMREAVAAWLMCGCDEAQRMRVVMAASAGGDNCAARWEACGRSDCLALLSAEALDIPIPQPAREGGGGDE